MTAAGTLRAVPFLAPLPEDEIAALAREARPRQYRAGATIFYRDDPGSTLHVIHRGRVKLVLASPEGREVTVGVLGPGAFFGEMALIDGGRRSASAVALEAVETVTLDRAVFLATLERRPAAALALLTILGERLRRTDEMLQDVLFLDLPARLAKHLLALAGEHGVAAQGGAPRPAAESGRTGCAGGRHARERQPLPQRVRRARHPRARPRRAHHPQAGGAAPPDLLKC